MPFEFIFVIALFALAYRVIRSVMSPDGMVEQARKAAGKLAEEVKEAARPGSPHVAWPGPRPGVRLPAARKQVAVRPATTAAQNARAKAGQRDVTPQDWYFVLDVSPEADRGEIQDALKLRLSRARANRDSEAMRRAVQAAAAGMTAPRRARD